MSAANRNPFWASDNPRRLPSIEEVTLSDAEKNQLKAVREHLRKVARQDAFEHTPEGSINGILNKCTPRVQEFIRLNQELGQNVMDTGGRGNLFSKPIEIKLDPLDQKVLDRSVTEDAIHGIHERLGTQASQEKINDRPASLREQLEASFDTSPSESEGGNTD